LSFGPAKAGNPGVAGYQGQGAFPEEYWDLFMQADSKMIQPRYELFYLAMVLVVASLYRLYPINRGLGQDELYTAVHFVEVGSIWKTIFSNDAFNNHIGYSLMARVSEALFGRSEWALRLPALLLGLASLYFFWIFSRSILAYPAAMVATFMFALSPPHIIWSIEARGYSAMIFFTILSTYLYFRLLRHPTRHHAFFFIVVSVCGVYVHLYSAFVTLVQILLFLRISMTQHSAKKPDPQITRMSARMLYVSFLAIITLSFISYIPASWPMLRDLVGRGRGDFDPLFPWKVIQELTGSDHMQIVVLFIMVGVLGWFSLLKSRPLEARYFAWLFVGPLLVMWLARPFDLYPRFFAYWLPYYFVFFMAGLRALWHSAPTANVRLISYLSRTLAAVIITAVLHNWSVNWQNYIPDEGYREASRAIAMDADDSVAFCAIGGARSIWRYYINKPITTPSSLAELQKLSSSRPEVRCVYYEASWHSREQTEIAQFLLQHGSWQRVKDLTLFIYRG